MPSQSGLPEHQMDLRLRAAARLKGHEVDIKRASASQALGVLFQLASSPSTAQDALALLHELQVHQIELEIQDEELRGSRAELEHALNRQIELYDCAPVSYFTIDAETVLHELNLRGSRLLGFERSALLGRPLDSFLDERSAARLRALITLVEQDQRGDVCELDCMVCTGTPRTIHASLTRDSVAQRFLLAFNEPAAG